MTERRFEVDKTLYDPYTLIAYRSKDNPKWELAGEFITLQEVEILYKQKFQENLEICKIIEGGWVLKTHHEYVKSRFLWDAFGRGWSFDVKSGSWIKPTEPFTEPKYLPLTSTEFKISVDEHKHGWLGLIFTLGELTIKMSWSDVFDPLPRLITWLENIVQGESSRIWIDEEGRYHELIAYIKNNGQVRLIINYYSPSWEMADGNQIHAILPQKLVVGQFYDILTWVNKPEEFSKWTDLRHNRPIPFYTSVIVENFLKG